MTWEFYAGVAAGVALEWLIDEIVMIRLVRRAAKESAALEGIEP